MRSVPSPTADDRPATAKAELRREVLALRRGADADLRAAWSSVIQDRLRDLPELARARALLGYAAFGSEASIDGWLEERAAGGDGVFLPWVDGRELRIARIRDLESDTCPGFRGIREPKAIGRAEGRPDRVAAAVVPGVAFDRRGGRLGYGGGFYDRLLTRLRPGVPVIGVAFALQVVQEVPTGLHDRRVDAVVTEDAVYRWRVPDD